jgi:hypothetical protein
MFRRGSNDEEASGSGLNIYRAKTRSGNNPYRGGINAEEATGAGSGSRAAGIHRSGSKAEGLYRSGTRRASQWIFRSVPRADDEPLPRSKSIRSQWPQESDYSSGGFGGNYDGLFAPVSAPAPFHFNGIENVGAGFDDDDESEWSSEEEEEAEAMDEIPVQEEIPVIPWYKRILPYKRPDLHPPPTERAVSAEHGANIFSILTFTWVGPLMTVFLPF